MYQPKHFRISDHARLHALIEDNALAMIVTVVDGSPEVNHVPVVLDASEGPHGRLRFHLARANPLANRLSSAQQPADELMFVFRGEQAYVSPDWYGAQNGTQNHANNMVPTWNYAVVHAHGRAAVLDDDALVDVLDDLSSAQEGRLDKTPWTTQNMDLDLYVKMRGAIVGFQMPIARLEGKFKMSQNRPDSARGGVITALDSLDSDNAHKTAGTMRALAQDGKAEPNP